jgi:hypothetical protein
LVTPFQQLNQVATQRSQIPPKKTWWGTTSRGKKPVKKWDITKKNMDLGSTQYKKKDNESTMQTPDSR